MYLGQMCVLTIEKIVCPPLWTVGGIRIGVEEGGTSRGLCACGCSGVI